MADVDEPTTVVEYDTFKLRWDERTTEAVMEDTGLSVGVAFVSFFSGLPNAWLVNVAQHSCFL